MKIPIKLIFFIDDENFLYKGKKRRDEIRFSKDIDWILSIVEKLSRKCLDTTNHPFTQTIMVNSKKNPDGNWNYIQVFLCMGFWKDNVVITVIQ